ncbi:MAG: hypothetical protein PF450_08565 [Bacteroidales bacterium]|jgi:hypothetical protein|nr:hypothetical protein [Bacteroidales bacterium]
MKNFLIISLICLNSLLFGAIPVSQEVTLPAAKSEQILDIQEGIITGSISLKEVYLNKLSKYENYIQIYIN